MPLFATLDAGRRTSSHTYSEKLACIEEGFSLRSVVAMEYDLPGVPGSSARRKPTRCSALDVFKIENGPLIYRHLLATTRDCGPPGFKIERYAMTNRCAVLMALMSALVACVALGQQPRPTPLVPEGTVIHRDLSYVTDGHERQRLDLYLPKAGKDLPLIIWVHGGAWLAGSKANPVPLPYLADGYAVASINYRLSQHAVFPAQIQDCKAAVRWLRANAAKYDLDPNHFAAWGASAGGHLVAMLGTTADVKEFEVGEHLAQSSRVQAVVDFFGPTDLLQMDEHRVPNGQVHDIPDSPESKLVGGPIQENKDKVAKANPITFVTRDDPPFLIVHGDADPLVPHHQSELLEAALNKAGVPVTLYTVKGGGHGGFKDPKVQELTKEFLAKHLKTSHNGAATRP